MILTTAFLESTQVGNLSQTQGWGLRLPADLMVRFVTPSTPLVS